MRDLAECRAIGMLLHNDLVKVLWVKAYMKGTIRFVRVCEGQYPISRLGQGL